MTRLRNMRRRRRYLTLGIAALAVFVLAGSALAFYLASGSGTASVSGGSAPTLTIAGGTPSGDLYPGQAVTVPFDVTLSGAGSVGAVHVASIDTPAGCDASWFTFDDSAALGELPAGQTADAGHVTVHMVESHTDQSACEGGAFTLHLVAN